VWLNICRQNVKICQSLYEHQSIGPRMTAHDKQNHSLTHSRNSISLETEAKVEFSYAGNIMTLNMFSNVQVYCLY
jgi:hypothetical protein